MLYVDTPRLQAEHQGLFSQAGTDLAGLLNYGLDRWGQGQEDTTLLGESSKLEHDKTGNFEERKPLYNNSSMLKIEGNKLGWSRATLEITFGPLNLENKQNLGWCVGG